MATTDDQLLYLYYNRDQLLAQPYEDPIGWFGEPLQDRAQGHGSKEAKEEGHEEEDRSKDRKMFCIRGRNGAERPIDASVVMEANGQADKDDRFRLFTNERKSGMLMSNRHWLTSPGNYDL